MMALWLFLCVVKVDFILKKCKNRCKCENPYMICLALSHTIFYIFLFCSYTVFFLFNLWCVRLAVLCFVMCARFLWVWWWKGFFFKKKWAARLQSRSGKKFNKWQEIPFQRRCKHWPLGCLILPHACICFTVTVRRENVTAEQRIPQPRRILPNNVISR